ncbi:hypothetical protein [Vagococcus acidifermentans]
MSNFKNMDLNSEEAQSDAMYLNLVQQLDLLARQEQAILFENPPLFKESALELTKVRKKVYQMPDYSKYQDYLPTESENFLDETFYQKVNNNHFKIYTKEDNLVLALAHLLALLSLLWLPLVTILCSDILVEETKHQSLTQGFPFSALEKMLMKIVFLATTFSFVLCLVPFIMLILTFFYPLGNLDYPQPVYLFSYQTVSFWQYGLLIFGYLLLVLLFVLLTSLLVNFLTKNSQVHNLV